MLDTLDQQPPDALLALIKLYEADQRAGKIDLGVGVYRTSDGATPVFAAIKAAERRLADEQQTKAYLGPEGDMGFVHALVPHVFGADAAADPGRGGRIEGMQTPGGTGALRLAAALAARAGVRRVLMGLPSWPNHAPIVTDLGLEVVGFDHATRQGVVDMDALRSVLAEAQRGDAVLLHGCCHNPTGIDYAPGDWEEIASLVAERGVLPIIDLAYQGLGRGMDEDAAGLRTVLAAVPEALVAYSCDKNFGLYRDRVGALFVIAGDGPQTARVMTNAHAIARATWSMPPDHGAAAVRLVLGDAQLTKSWRSELATMRERIADVRRQLAAAGTAGPVELAPLGSQHGMFATLPLSREQIATLRAEHGVYMAGSGRINVAGLTQGNIGRFVAALESLCA